MRWDSVRLGSSNLTRTLIRVPAARFQALKKPYTDHDLLQICPLIRSYLAPQKLRKLLFVKYKDKMVMEEIKQQLGRASKDAELGDTSYGNRPVAGEPSSGHTDRVLEVPRTAR